MAFCFLPLLLLLLHCFYLLSVLLRNIKFLKSYKKQSRNRFFCSFFSEAKCHLFHVSIGQKHSQNIFFLLAGHKVDFIAPCGANKSIFWPYSRKKIVCNAGKTFILLVWLLPSLCSGIKIHTRKINFFCPSCTIYYFFP